MLSTCHVSFSVANNVQNKHSSSKACFQTDVFSCNSLVNKVDLLHRRFSHPYHNVFIHLLKNDQTINLSTSLINQAAQQICEACQMGKSHRSHFHVTETKTSQVLELIHTEL